MSTHSTVSPLTTQQRHLVVDYVAKARETMRTAGQDEMVDRLDAALAVPRPPQPAVVVLGESGCGKSTLVEALLSRAGVAPSDCDLSTGAIVHYNFGPSRIPVVTTPDGPVDDLAAWRRRVLVDPRERRQFESHEVRLDAPLLRGLSIVDTPGLNGFEVSEGEQLLDLLSGSEAALFVTDPSGPLTASALAFLTRVRERVDELAVVLTKIDDFRGWAAIHDHDLTLLRQARLNSVPLLTVSGWLARRAATAQPTDVQAHAESRITRLGLYLGARVALRRELLAETRAVRTTLVACTDARKRLDQAKKELSDDRPKSEALQEATRQLKAAGAARQHSQVDREIRAITLDHSEVLRRRLQELQRQYVARAERGRRGDALHLPDELFGALQEVLQSIGREVDERLRVLVSALAGEVDAQSVLAAALVRTAQSTLHQGTDHRAAAEPRPMGLSERMSAVSSFSSGRGIAAGALGFLGPVSLAATGASVALGTTFAVLSARGRQDAASRTELRGWVREQVQAVQADASSAFARSLHEVQSELHATLTEASQRRQTRLQEVIDDLRTSSDNGRDQSRREITTLTENARRVRVQEDRGREVLAALHRTTSTKGTPS